MANKIEDFLPVVKYHGLNTEKTIDVTSGTLKATDVYDTNGNRVVQFNSNASAVNYVKTSNQAAGSGVRIEAAGGDTSIQLLLGGKGAYVTEFLSSGTATAAAGAVTANNQMSKITTEALTTAAGASYTLTVTNNKIQTFSRLMCTVGNGTNSAGEPCLLTCTQGVGTATVVVKNVHGANAFNGTLIINVLVL